MNINELKNEVHELAKEKGWYDNPEIEDQYIERMCNNLHDKVSELHTAWRENKLHDNCDKPISLSCLEEELADIIIRVLDNCGRLGVDIKTAVLIKHQYNKTRSYRHGGKRS